MDGRTDSLTKEGTPHGAFHSGILEGPSPSTVPLAARAQEHPWVPSTTTVLPSGSFYLIERSALDELLDHNLRLRQDISDLVGKVAELVDLLRADCANRPENVIVLREIPRRQAKREILKLFQESGPLYYSDIAEELRLDLELAVDLCSELEKEQKIKLAE